MKNFDFVSYSELRKKYHNEIEMNEVPSSVKDLTEILSLQHYIQNISNQLL